MDVKRIIIFVTIFLLISLVIYFVTKEIFKQYKEKCGDEDQMFDRGLNKCRKKCDYEKNNNNCKTSECTHYDNSKGGCIPCPSGKIWTGSTCTFNCNNHGYIDNSGKVPKCKCQAESDKYVPVRNLKCDKNPSQCEGKGLNNVTYFCDDNKICRWPGWEGDNCKKPLDKCTSDALKGLKDYPRFSSRDTNNDTTKILCSGNGTPTNNGDYTSCVCQCDQGWTGKTCNNLSNDKFGRGNATTSCMVLDHSFSNPTCNNGLSTDKCNSGFNMVKSNKCSHLPATDDACNSATFPATCEPTKGAHPPFQKVCTKDQIDRRLTPEEFCAKQDLGCATGRTSKCMPQVGTIIKDNYKSDLQLANQGFCKCSD